MSARKLPFVVQPRVALTKETLGSKESGQIEVERRGYTTVGEKALVQEAMKGSHAMPELYAFVKNVAEDVGKTPEQVLADLSTSPTPDYLLVWEDDATARLEAVQMEGTRRCMVHATAILISRVDSQWTIDDTLQLHSDLVDALSEFYIKEEKGSEDILEDSSNNTGAEGKE